jgi:hypothetical protein
MTEPHYAAHVVRAVLDQQVRCETCKWWKDWWECVSSLVKEHTQWWDHQGEPCRETDRDFGCRFWEGREG